MLLGTSVLTTKQHYLWDIFAGTMLAGIVYLLILKPGYESISGLEPDSPGSV